MAAFTAAITSSNRLGVVRLNRSISIFLIISKPAWLSPMAKRHGLNPVTVQSDWTTNHYNPTEQLVMLRVPGAKSLSSLSCCRGFLNRLCGGTDDIDDQVGV